MLYTIHNKAATLNGQKLQRDITPTTFHLIDSKFNQVISFSVPISIPNIKALAHFLRYLVTDVPQIEIALFQYVVLGQFIQSKMG